MVIFEEQLVDFRVQSVLSLLLQIQLVAEESNFLGLLVYFLEVLLFIEEIALDLEIDLHSRTQGLFDVKLTLTAEVLLEDLGALIAKKNLVPLVESALRRLPVGLFQHEAILVQVVRIQLVPNGSLS